MKNKTKIVNKNDIIETKMCAMTVFEKRTLLLAMAQIIEGDGDLKKYYVTIEDLSKIFKIDPNHLYNEAKHIDETLGGKKIVTKYKDKNGVLKSKTNPWFKEVKYDGKGVISIIFNDILKPSLIKLKNNFTILYLENMIELRRYHSLRLYELLYSYRKTGWRYFEICELKDFMGFGDKNFKKYNNFKRIIVKSITEINKKTDINVRLEEIKKSRKVIALKFKITTKPKTSSDEKIEEKYTKEDSNPTYNNLPYKEKKMMNECFDRCHGNCGAFKYGNPEEKRCIVCKQINGTKPKPKPPKPKLTEEERAKRKTAYEKRQAEDERMKIMFDKNL